MVIQMMQIRKFKQGNLVSRDKEERLTWSILPQSTKVRWAGGMSQRDSDWYQIHSDTNSSHLV